MGADGAAGQQRCGARLAAQICTSGKTARSSAPTPVMVPPVPKPEQKPSMAMPAARTSARISAAVPSTWAPGCRFHERAGARTRRGSSAAILCERDAPRCADVALVVDADHLGAVMLHDAPALHRAGVRHDDAGRVALHSRHKGEPHALVAARGLHNNGIRRQLAPLLGTLDHLQRRARLHRAAHVHRLELHEHLGVVGPGHAPQPHERRRSHSFQNVIADHSFP